MGTGVGPRQSLLQVDRRGGVSPSTPEDKRVDRWVGAVSRKVGAVSRKVGGVNMFTVESVHENFNTCTQKRVHVRNIKPVCISLEGFHTESCYCVLLGVLMAGWE